MYPKFKTNLIGLAVALSFVLVGFGLGETPRAPYAHTLPGLGQVGLETPAAEAEADRPIRRGALMRHLAMPYISFAALTPRQES